MVPKKAHHIAVAVGFAFVALLALVFAVKARCGSHVVFSLDDPYIHFAVGRTILQGGYGINVGEYSSPSSSVIWPPIVALLTAIGDPTLGVVLLDGLFALATVALVTAVLYDVSAEAGADTGWATTPLFLVCVFVVSAVALPLTGLEHSLHVLTAIAAFVGLVRFAQSGRLGAGLVVALVVMPYVRFEGFAFALAGTAACFLLGARRAAVAMAAAIVALFGVYAGVMKSLGLPLLPSSVLVKSAIAESVNDDGRVMGQLVAHLNRSLHRGEGLLLLFFLVVIAGLVFAEFRKGSRLWIVYGAVLAAGGAHFLLGEYGWFHRYEVYVIALTSVCAMHGSIRFLHDRGGAREALLVRVVPLAFAVIAAVPYVVAAVRTPAAASNIHQQQYQMGRFVGDFYKGSVAVNDLGLVAYFSRSYVLDLVGLGSEEVRRAKATGTFGKAEIDGLVRRHGIDLVIVYASWFEGQIPAEWTRIAELHTPRVVSDSGDVTFFQVGSADRDRLRDQLRAFARDLPPESRLEIF